MPIGPTTVYFTTSRTTRRCSAVSGCSYMSVFIAGNTYVGVVGASARSRDVCWSESHYSKASEDAERDATARLSQMPPAILASVFAEQGATRTTSAQRRSSMCSMGSPIL